MAKKKQDATAADVAVRPEKKGKKSKKAKKLFKEIVVETVRAGEPARANVDDESRTLVLGIPDGTPGVAGPVGPKGPMGPPGPQGPAGPAGPEGPQGPQGSQGPRGEAGEQGPQGPQGPQGQRGEAGARGAAGERGEPGVGVSYEQAPAGAERFYLYVDELGRLCYHQDGNDFLVSLQPKAADQPEA